MVMAGSRHGDDCRHGDGSRHGDATVESSLSLVIYYVKSRQKFTILKIFVPVCS